MASRDDFRVIRELHGGVGQDDELVPAILDADGLAGTFHGREMAADRLETRVPPGGQLLFGQRVRAPCRRRPDCSSQYEAQDKRRPRPTIERSGCLRHCFTLLSRYLYFRSSCGTLAGYGLHLRRGKCRH